MGNDATTTADAGLNVGPLAWQDDGPTTAARAEAALLAAEGLPDIVPELRPDLCVRQRPWPDGEPSVESLSRPTPASPTVAGIGPAPATPTLGELAGGSPYLPDYAPDADPATDAARGHGRPAAGAALARHVLADLIEAARDAEALAEALESRDLTAAEAAAVIEAECPGLEFDLLETATERRRGAAAGGPESLRTCGAVVRPGGVRRPGGFCDTTWRAVVAGVLAWHRRANGAGEGGGQ